MNQGGANGVAIEAELADDAGDGEAVAEIALAGDIGCVTMGLAGVFVRLLNRGFFLTGQADGQVG